MYPVRRLTMRRFDDVIRQVVAATSAEARRCPTGPPPASVGARETRMWPPTGKRRVRAHLLDAGPDYLQPCARLRAIIRLAETGSLMEPSRPRLD